MTWRITPKAAGEAIELVLYGVVGGGWAGDGIVAADVVKGLQQHARARRIDVYLNSPGGNAFDGQAIYSALQRHQAGVTVHIDGEASSAASLIAMAGDTIRIASGGFMMIHEPSTMAMGNAAELRETADTLERLSRSMAETYAARTGKPADEIERLMAAETWFSAEDAVAFGLATELVAAKRAVACSVPPELAARQAKRPVVSAPPIPSPATRAAVEELDLITARMDATLAAHRLKRLSA